MTEPNEPIVWAWVCPRCRHLATKHGLIGTDIVGPYECPCGCRIMQSDRMVGLTRAEYTAHRKFPKIGGAR